MFRKIKSKISKTDNSKVNNESKSKSSYSQSSYDQRHSRRSSDLKYLLPRQHQKYQKSEYYINIAATSQRKPKAAGFVVEHKKVVFRVHNPEKEDSRDFHDAIDFYHRSSGVPMPNESLSNLRRSLTQRGRIHKSRPKVPKLEHGRKYSHYPKRCRRCLHLKDDCVCKTSENDDANNKISNTPDWMIIVSPDASQHRYETNRLKWLEELEENSNINKLNLEEKRENQEICCFPFSTFGIFNKIEKEEIDFYRKQ